MDIKISKGAMNDDDRATLTQTMHELGFDPVEAGESNGQQWVVLRNQAAKGLKVQELRDIITQAGGEVLEVA